MKDMPSKQVMENVPQRTESFLSDCSPQIVGLPQLITVCTSFIAGKVAERILVGYAPSIAMTHRRPTKESRKRMERVIGRRLI
jgi:hypothetical protein